EAAADRAGRGQVQRLVQLDLAVAVLDGDHGILEVDQVLALQLAQLQADLFRLVHVVIADHDKSAHEGLLTQVPDDSGIAFVPAGSAEAIPVSRAARPGRELPCTARRARAGAPSCRP